MEADYFGVASGNQEPRKFEKSGLTAEKSLIVDAPVINEFPLCLECRFIEYQENEFGVGVIGKVVNITADESVIGAKGGRRLPGAGSEAGAGGGTAGQKASE